jgi:hypothetical protein
MASALAAEFAAVGIKQVSALEVDALANMISAQNTYFTTGVD